MRVYNSMVSTSSQWTYIPHCLPFPFSLFIFVLFSSFLSRLSFHFMIKMHAQNPVCIDDQMFQCVRKKTDCDKPCCFLIVYFRIKYVLSYKCDSIEWKITSQYPFRSNVTDHMDGWFTKLFHSEQIFFPFTLEIWKLCCCWSTFK